MSNIKINDVPQRVQYAATNGQTQFAIPFPFFNDFYVIVWQDGIQLFPGGAPGQYAISGAGSPSGGLITLVTPATLDSIITIQGDMPIDRTSIYSATISNLTGSDLNGDFNREVVMMKQIQTTQAFLQLQYAPWALVSQDLDVTRDRYIPLLGPQQVWRMNEAGTAIEAYTVDGIPAPSNSYFITYGPDPSLENEQNLGLLGDGLLKQTVTGGFATLDIAVPNVDYVVGPLGTMAFQNANNVNITGGVANLTAGQVAAYPLLPDDLVNKSYADSISAGFTFKSAVLAATTANLSATYDNGTSGVGATLTAVGNGVFNIDGESPGMLSRVLIKNQSSQAENGVYVVTDTGSVGTPYVLTRATDFDSPAEIVPGSIVFVQTGTTLASSSWVETNPVLTVGTDPIQFIQFSQQYPLSMGNGGTGSSITPINSAVFSTTALGVGQLSTTLPAGLTIPGYAHSAANSDITSMTGLTGGISAPTFIGDSNFNEVIAFGAAVASAVNEYTFTNAATGNAPTIAATGGDTNINWDTTSKGTGIHIARSANTSTPIQWNTGTTLQHTTNWILPNTAQTRNYTLQDADGTIAFTSDVGSFLIASASASSSTDIQFTNLTGYTNYMIVFNEFIPAVHGAGLVLQYSLDNGATWRSTAGDYYWQIALASNTTFVGQSSSAGGSHPIASPIANAVGAGAGGSIILSALNNTSVAKSVVSTAGFVSSTGPTVSMYTANGTFRTSGQITAVRLIMTSGVILIGTAQIYGLK